MSAGTLILFLLGFALLIAGAELLVRGASRLAVAVGISPLVVGLTVVAFGTSAPELAVTARSGAAGADSLAIGNVFGSNITNILLILGLSAVVVPLIIHTQLIRRDVPLMIVASLVVLLMVLDGGLSRVDGVVLVVGAVAYTAWTVRESRREQSADYERDLADEKTRPGAWWVNAGIIVVGLVMLVLGAEWLVDGAREIAVSLGLSELVIGLTIVAVGTSLPELATALVASARGERDIVAGNVVGSNIFNLLLVLGVGAAVSPGGLVAPAAAVRFDGPVMLAVAVACLPVFFNGGVIHRWEGAVFVAYYAAYIVYLLLDASAHDAVTAYGAVMLGFVIPLTVITLVVVTVRTLRRGRAAGESSLARR